MRKRVILVVSGVFVLFSLAFLVFYYSNRYYPNTQLQCDLFVMDVGNLTYLESADKICEKLNKVTYILVGSLNETYTVSLKNVSEPILRTRVEEVLKSTPKTSKERKYMFKLEDIVTFDKTKIISEVQQIENSINKKDKRSASNAFIQYDLEKKEFVIVPDICSTEFTDVVPDILIQCMSKFDDKPINLVEQNCYSKADIMFDNVILQKNLLLYNEYASTVLSYVFWNGVVETIDSTVYFDWLVPNYSVENYMDIHTASQFSIDKSNWREYVKIVTPIELNTTNPFSIDKTKLREYVQMLNSKYTTVNTPHTFVNSYGETISTSAGNYGWWLNSSKMVSDIETHILQRQSEKKDAIYRQVALSNGEKDFGSTYIEISIQNQHLWLYDDSKLVMDCDVVTGNVREGSSTPLGWYALTYKTKNVVLRGPGYASPVSYWMPFNGGIGMHDAPWRRTFGGTYYKYEGSHGCVNMPLKSAKIAYDYMKVGVPIIVW